MRGAEYKAKRACDEDDDSEDEDEEEAEEGGEDYRSEGEEDGAEDQSLAPPACEPLQESGDEDWEACRKVTESQVAPTAQGGRRWGDLSRFGW